MSVLLINKEECTRCGACIAECPVNILAMNEEKIPATIKDGEKRCINCGHCVTVCPVSAASLDTMDVNDCVDLPQNWRLTPEKVKALLKGRRSIRNFTDEAVDKKVITDLIDAARYAPSGINTQPVKWAVVYEKAKVQELSKLVVEWMRGLVEAKAPIAESLHMDNMIKACESGRDWICRGASHVVLTYALKEDPMAPAASIIALTYLDLMAASYSLGACWAGYVQMAVNSSPEVMKFLGLSKKSACTGAMMLGYPKYDYYAIPTRNKPHTIWVPKE
jgi:nitroreductase/NAD-dependent dihydropyrimidine dehydrogenase PreA subunit